MSEVVGYVCSVCDDVNAATVCTLRHSTRAVAVLGPVRLEVGRVFWGGVLAGMVLLETCGFIDEYLRVSNLLVADRLVALAALGGRFEVLSK